MTRNSLHSAVEHVTQALRQPATGPVKARLRRVIQDLPVAALVADDHARLVAVNEAAAHLTGYSMAELLRLSVPEITATSDRPHTDRLWESFVSHGQQSGQYDIRRKDGGTITVEYRAIASVAPGVHLSLLQPSKPSPPRRGDPAIPGDGTPS